MNTGVIQFRWIWPGVIFGSALTSGLFFFLGLASPFRLIAALWFLLVCPGMAFVRLLRFDRTYFEWTLAIALSISLDAIVACILLYTGLWSIELGLALVIAVSLLGAGLQVWRTRPQAMKSQSMTLLSLRENAASILICPSCGTKKRQSPAGFTRSRRQKYRCGHCQRVYSPGSHRQDSPIEVPRPSRPHVMEKQRYNALQWILHVNPRHLTRQTATGSPVSGSKARLKKRSRAKRSQSVHYRSYTL